MIVVFVFCRCHAGPGFKVDTKAQTLWNEWAWPDNGQGMKVGERARLEGALYQQGRGARGAVYCLAIARFFLAVMERCEMAAASSVWACRVGGGRRVGRSRVRRNGPEADDTLVRFCAESDAARSATIREVETPGDAQWRLQQTAQLQRAGSCLESAA